MGQSASVNFTLVDATPYRNRYLLTPTGVSGTTVLPNAAGATPDLRTDLTENHAGGLRKAVTTPVANQAEARRILLGEENAGAPLQAHIGRAHCYITPRGGTRLRWAVDADEGAAAGSAPSAGFPVLLVFVDASEIVIGDSAYLDVVFEHSHHAAR
jgi:hypothetical protein